jgi:hypothetical protein
MQRARGKPNFVASSPEIYRHQDGNYEQCDTKFACHVPGLAVVDRERIEEFLNECIVCGVQYDTGPQTAGLEPHPRPHKADGRQQHGEQWKVVPDRCAAVIAVCQQKNGIVPQGPNESRNDGGRRKAVSFRKFRYQKSSSADLLSKDRGAIPDYSYCRCEEEVEDNAHPRAYRAESKGFGKAPNEQRVVKAPQSS